MTNVPDYLRDNSSQACRGEAALNVCPLRSDSGPQQEICCCDMPGVVIAVENNLERLVVQRVLQDTLKKAGISKFPDVSRLLNLRGCRKSLDPIAVLSYWLRLRVSLEILRRDKHAAQHTTSLKPCCLQVPLTPADFPHHAKHLGSCGGAISNTAPLTDSDLEICVEVLSKLWEDYHLRSHLAEMQGVFRMIPACKTNVLLPGLMIVLLTCSKLQVPSSRAFKEQEPTAWKTLSLCPKVRAGFRSSLPSEPCSVPVTASSALQISLLPTEAIGNRFDGPEAQKSLCSPLHISV